MSASDPFADPAAAGSSRLRPSTAYRSRHAPFSSAPPEIPDHELVECIGHGSFGDVWLARTIMGAYRAIKIVYRHAFDHPRPFEREFEGIRRFEPVSRRHESQMAILQVGRNDEAGFFYYVMELADDGSREAVDQESGEARAAADSVVTTTIQPESYIPKTLKFELSRRGRLPVAECLRIGLSLTTALEHLHGHGLIHRDIKPSNIIFIEGVPKLADIGLISTLDATMSVSGTPGYIAPEGSGTPQADIYSLGKVLYEMSMGRDRAEFPRLPDDFESLPGRQRLLELNAVVVKASAGDPARRYQTAAEMHADLALIRSGRSIKGLRRMERHLAQVRRVAAGLAVVALIIAGAWWQTNRAQRTATALLAESQLNEGTQHLLHDNPAAALPWLTGALQLGADGTRREAPHRARIGAVLRQCPRPIGLFSIDGAPALSAHLSQDGRVLATAHEDWQVRLWDVQTGELISSLSHEMPVLFCQFLDGSDTLLTWGVREAFVWDLSAQPPARLSVPHKPIGAKVRGYYCVGLNSRLHRAYLSKGGYRFARSHRFDGAFVQIGLWMKLVAEAEAVTAHYEFRDLTRSNAVLFSGKFKDTLDPDPLDEGRDTPPEPVCGCLFLSLSDFSFGQGTGDSSHVVWSNLWVRSYPIDSKPVSTRDLSDGFSSDYSNDWVIRGIRNEDDWCRVESGQLDMGRPVLPQGQSLLCASWLELLELRSGQTLEVGVDLVGAYAPQPVVELSLTGAEMDTVRWQPIASPNGQLLAVNPGGDTIRLWDLRRNQFRSIVRDGCEVPMELRAREIVRQVRFSPDSRYLAALCGWRGELAVWDVQNGQRLELDFPADAGCADFCFSADGRFLILAGPGGLNLVDTGSWRLVHTLAEEVAVTQVAVSPVGSWLAAVRDSRSIGVWDLSDLEKPPVILQPESSPQSITFNPDGRYLGSDSEDGYVRLWSVNEGHLASPPLRGRFCQFSADGSQLLVRVPERGVWLWDLSRVMPMTLSVPPVAATETTARSADGTLSVLLQGHQARISGTPTELGPLDHPLPLRRASFSADNRYLISETSDLRSWIWDAATGTLMAPPYRTEYDTTAPEHPALSLSEETQDLEVLEDLAALLGGQRFDPKEGMKTLTPQALEQLYYRLKVAAADELTVTPEDQERWHAWEAAQSEREGAWAAAVFHWERVQGADRDSHTAAKEHPATEKVRPNAESRLAYARLAADALRAHILGGESRASFIPPRPPWAEPAQVDLTSLYTQALGAEVSPARRDNSFRKLASGTQVLGGVAFDVRGLIRLDHTRKVRVPIGRACQRIHFLHAASGEGTVHREVAGTYQVTYATGESAQVQLLNPEDLPPCSTTWFHKFSSLTNSIRSRPLSHRFAWAGINEEVASRNETLFLTRTTWELPEEHRGKIVQCLELQAGPSDSVPLIFAITVE